MEEEQGPVPGHPNLSSACNANSHSSRASAEAGPDFPEADCIPVETDLGLPEEDTIQTTVYIGASKETQVRS